MLFTDSRRNLNSKAFENTPITSRVLTFDADGNFTSGIIPQICGIVPDVKLPSASKVSKIDVIGAMLTLKKKIPEMVILAPTDLLKLYQM